MSSLYSTLTRSHASVTGQDPWTTEFLPEYHLLHIGSDKQTETWSSHGITSVAHNSKPLVYFAKGEPRNVEYCKFFLVEMQYMGAQDKETDYDNLYWNGQLGWTPALGLYTGMDN